MTTPKYTSTGVESTHWMALPASIAIHIGLAWMLTQIPNEPLPPKTEWMEMMVVEVEKEEPPPPPPEPEPEPEEPPPNQNRSQNRSRKKLISRTSPLNQLKSHHPELPPPTKKKKSSVYKGLSASSFANNGNTGLTVRAGTTLNTQATSKTIDIEAKERVRHLLCRSDQTAAFEETSAVKNPPNRDRCRY